jgi:hypothetical protein
MLETDYPFVERRSLQIMGDDLIEGASTQGVARDAPVTRAVLADVVVR